VTCPERIYHPNIDLDGNICLNILKLGIAEDGWKPVLSLSSLLFGLAFLLSEPNASDPLNREAAQLLGQGAERFAQVVNRTLKGGAHDGTQFARLL
jgi:ubiquitin-conjugating enzyme E2 M